MHLDDELLDYRLYVNDDGRVTCDELRCDCEGEILAGLGRRVTLHELLDHMVEHWRK